MEPNNQPWLLRYYRLKGRAKIEDAKGLIKVTLLDGNPKNAALHFDSPLKYDTSDENNIKSITTGDLSSGAVERNVNFDAGFDEAWFKAAMDDGFPFKPTIRVFTDLAEPPMSVVKPPNLSNISE